MEFRPALVVFDKDGTLLDFHAMWGGWVRELAARLEADSGLAVSQALFRAYGYDSADGRARADSFLAITPMATLRVMAGEVLRKAGHPASGVESALAAAWRAPDPVATARPLADLPALFVALRERGAKITVATGDDRSPTEAALAACGVAGLVDALACADDGFPPKPQADMVVYLCRLLDVPAAQTMVVGDTVADMQMARGAGAGLAVGVLSGVSPAEVLAPHADVLLNSVAELI